MSETINPIEEIQEDLKINKEPKVYTGVINSDLTEGSLRYEDVFTNYAANEVVEATRKGNIFTFKCQNGVILKANVLTTGLIKLSYSFDGDFEPDFSYAIDPAFKPAPINPAFTSDGPHYQIRTASLVAKIRKDDLAVRFETLDGQLINEDDAGYFARTTILKGITTVGIEKKALPGEVYLGLGDKSGQPNLRGKKLENWNTDSFAYDTDTDPLYRAIPFYFGLQDEQAYGIFFDNSYRSHFDFDSKDDGVLRFWADGGEVNYYFFYEENLTEVAKAYIGLTGKAELPPLWALGFHQCRWSYYPESRVRELADQFRDHNIPCDAIYLDIDYMDGYRCFTWDYNHFPNPGKLLSDLKEQGFQTVVMIDPGIRADPNYFVYQQGVENNYFCQRPDGRIMKGPVWPSSCAFPDYTHPDVREWWGTLYRDLYLQDGVSGFWNDMNEPAVFEVLEKTFPGDIRHHYEGQGSDHNRAHNIYGQQMVRATYNGLKKLKPNKRPLVITRATYSGGQRFSSAWTGDNVSSWDHLRIANFQCQRMSISGFSFIGTDIGGFVGRPDGELMVRWLQLGIFHPLYRVHSMGNNTDGAAEVDGEVVKQAAALDRMDQEPWSFGDPHTRHARRAIEMRYQLIAYIYTSFKKYCTDGTPVLRPLVFDYPKETNPNRSEFMCGPDLLACPVLDPGVDQQTCNLPEGRWYYLSNGRQFAGNQLVTMPVDLSSVPVFVKAGAVIPWYPVQQYTGQGGFEQIDLKVFYKKGTYVSHLYEDAGDGYGYEKEAYSNKVLTTEGSVAGFTLSQEIQGVFSVAYTKYRIRLMGLPFEATNVHVDGVPMDFELLENNVIVVVVSEEFGELEVHGEEY